MRMMGVQAPRAADGYWPIGAAGSAPHLGTISPSYASNAMAAQGASANVVSISTAPLRGAGWPSPERGGGAAVGASWLGGGRAVQIASHPAAMASSHLVTRQRSAVDDMSVPVLRRAPSATPPPSFCPPIVAPAHGCASSAAAGTAQAVAPDAGTAPPSGALAVEERRRSLESELLGTLAEIKRENKLMREELAASRKANVRWEAQANREQAVARAEHAHAAERSTRLQREAAAASELRQAYAEVRAERDAAASQAAALCERLAAAKMELTAAVQRAARQEEGVLTWRARHTAEAEEAAALRSALAAAEASLNDKGGRLREPVAPSVRPPAQHIDRENVCLLATMVTPAIVSFGTATPLVAPAQALAEIPTEAQAEVSMDVSVAMSAKMVANNEEVIEDKLAASDKTRVQLRVNALATQLEAWPAEVAPEVRPRPRLQSSPWPGSPQRIEQMEAQPAVEEQPRPLPYPVSAPARGNVAAKVNIFEKWSAPVPATNAPPKRRVTTGTAGNTTLGASTCGGDGTTSACNTWPAALRAGARGCPVATPLCGGPRRRAAS